MTNAEPNLVEARAAAKALRQLASDTKDAALRALSRRLRDDEARVLAANAEDLAALPATADAAFRDRLTLNPARLKGMRESLDQIAFLDDPVGEVAEKRTLKNGLQLRRVRAPIGVILMIFESRPNVAIEAFSIAFKSGNAILLRGGKESARTCEVLYDLIREALVEVGAPAACVTGITNPDRALVARLLTETQFIDLVVPRGGEGLIRFVVENSRIPIIKNDRGLCHVYVHDDADLDQAQAIVVNAKVSRPGVCNSMETVLIHSAIAARFIPGLYAATEPHHVEWHVCPKALSHLKGKSRVRVATAASFDTEYLDFKMNVKIVDSFDEALAHIERHGSRHSESICTRSEELARRFQNEVDAAAVYWNASTRFTDGFEFGLGGELGISTQKLHVRGPVGLRELTTPRWIIDGHGQVR